MAKQQNAEPVTQEVSPPQEAARLTMDQIKKQCCEKLKQLFTSQLMNERLMKMAGGDASRVAKNLTAFLTVITQDDGGSKDPNKKKYLCQCSIPSLTTCFLESMNMQLPFDSRKLICMIIYETANGLEAELDIEYKGFVNALNRHYKNAFVECKLVFDGDTFIVDINGRVATYQYKPFDPFAVVKKDFKNIKGGYCFFSYTDTDGQYTSRLVFLSRDQIMTNKRAARQQYVWEAHPKAMAEKTCIREGAKLPFAAIDLDIDIEEVANKHMLLPKPDSENKLKLLMAAQQEVVYGKKEDETEQKTTADATADRETDKASSASKKVSDIVVAEGNSDKGEITATAPQELPIIEQLPQEEKETTAPELTDDDFDEDAAAFAGRDD